ncbi:MAG: DUF2254 domain-containing protein [Acidimicrobiales bacterium]
MRKLEDVLRSSLFFVPMMFVLGSVVLAQVLLAVDERVDHLSPSLTATVDSSRNVLAVVAGATLTFAGIAFSISLLLISMAASQYSPRVVHGLFRDPFNKRVMGVVVGTFSYCLVVMRAVRGPLEDSGQPVVPSLATLLAVILGIVSVLSIIAFISHSAHSMDVSLILHRVTEDAIASVLSTWRLEADPSASEVVEPPEVDGFTISFSAHGWIQQVDEARMLEILPPRGCLRLETVPGRYAIAGTPLCTLWPVPAPDDAEGLDAIVRQAVVLGEARTMQQDVTYGVRQLADVALKALSPGVNDPTTAQDAIFHLGTVVRALLARTAPPRHRCGAEGRVLLLPQEVSHMEVIGLAFDEIRIASAGQPTVQIYLLEVLELIMLSLPDDGGTEVGAALREQADLVLEVSRLAELPASDLARVGAAHEHRFPR